MGGLLLFAFGAYLFWLSITRLYSGFKSKSPARIIQGALGCALLAIASYFAYFIIWIILNSPGADFR
ncbi:hypothetical protein VN24_20480 [Paenibacillus beijingensis]|uniref:Uncharacterized protein n=1 Tax=Paenibacillus beijingensis TaxID=1126833 RepID=A0A0D5NNB4_9BACL|nr:hypothetical protein VN24_20480 [Paenibacillus beijingensis]